MSHNDKKEKGTTIYIPDEDMLEEIKKKKKSEHEANYEVIERLLKGGD